MNAPAPESLADPTLLGAVELGAALRRRAASSQEATRAYLERIARLDPTLKAFVTVDADGALAAARRADDRLTAGSPLSELDGVPVAVKDNIAVAGLPRTCGVRGRADAIATEDAFAVTLLREAGAVILGTLNMHEGALGTTTDNPTYGRCLNPWGPLDGAGWTP
ncbi:MAG: amidase, partial [Caulobacterales bacterium]|nr:amidase [Caulobacterales bacterium]